MKPSHLVLSCVLLAHTAYASSPECIDSAVKQRLSDEAKQQFILACMAKRALGVDANVRTDQTESADQPAQANCNIPDRCTDLSSQLEATAAGPGGDARANSGHSFVRLKRISN